MVRLYTGAALKLGDHDHFDARLDVAVDLDGHLVSTEGLYGLGEPDAASIEVDAAHFLDGVGDVGGGDGAEEPLVLASAGLDGDDALVKGLGDLRGPIGQAPVPLLGLLHPAAGLLQLDGGRHLGEAAGNEEVAHVAPAHVHDVSPLPDLLDVLSQYDLHDLIPYLPTTYGRSAISRARFIAVAASRWCCGQRPVTLRARILPRSEVNRLSML